MSIELARPALRTCRASAPFLMLLSSLGSSAALAAQALPEGDGRELVESVCSTECHALGVIRASGGYDAAGWREVMSTMVDLPPAETSRVVNYLARNFPGQPGGQPALIPGDGETPAQQSGDLAPTALTSIEFARPELLYVLMLLPVWWLLVWPWGEGGVLYVRGGSEGHAAGRRGAAAVVTVLPKLLRVVMMAFLVVALAHPRVPEVVQESVMRGKGMVIAVDISTSMLADDMAGDSTRMEVAREAAVRFAQRRTMDELTLVAFSGEAVTRVPATDDPAVIVAGIESIQPQLVLDGTDISAAMLNSIAELADSERRDRVIVLLTDGAHNGSGVAPMVTARAAAAFGVRVHSIALIGEPDLTGSPPAIRAQLIRQMQVEAEMETVLTGISRVTGGQYYRASNLATLDSIYREIAVIEAPVQETEDVIVYRSLRMWPLLAALVMVALEAALRASRWGVLP